MYRENIEKILMVVSKMRENEANEEIHQCKGMNILIKADNEHYLQTSFLEFDLALQHKVRSTSKKKMKKRKSIYSSPVLYERIKSTSM